MYNLPINDTFVPKKISEENLKDFTTDDDRKAIEKTYQAIKERLFKNSPVRKKPLLTLIFGSSGTGVTTLIGRMNAQDQRHPVICNAEAFATEIPGFQDSIHYSQQYYEDHQGSEFPSHFGISAMRYVLQETTARYLPAGRYMQDRLMAEALEEGRDVLIAKRGRTSGGTELLKAIERVGTSLHTVLYQAPLKVKLSGFEDRFRQAHDIALTPAEVEAEHRTLTATMQKMADASKGALSIYFRKQNDRTALPVASSKGRSYTVYDRDGEIYFNGYFADEGITIASLMGKRKLTIA